MISVGCTKVSIVNNEYLIAGGKYFTHCIGVNSPGAIAGFEKMVSGLGVPVSIERTEGHVPSFMEKWVWCQVTRLEGDILEQINGEAAAEPGPAEVADKKDEKVNGHSKEEEKQEVSSEDEKGKKEDVKKQEKIQEEKKEEKKDEKKEVKKEEKKEDKKEEKKEEKKGGAKDLKDKLDSPKAKDKVLSKEKSNLDKKGKKAK